MTLAKEFQHGDWVQVRDRKRCGEPASGVVFQFGAFNNGNQYVDGVLILMDWNFFPTYLWFEPHELRHSTWMDRLLRPLRRWIGCRRVRMMDRRSL